MTGTRNYATACILCGKAASDHTEDGGKLYCFQRSEVTPTIEWNRVELKVDWTRYVQQFTTSVFT